jgi:Mg2+ and Co2+ transporter CorA
MHSYHIFYFPFIWENPAKAGLLLAEQTDLSAIPFNPYTNWLRCPDMKNETEKQDFYNEQNYYYTFVHNVLYDSKKPDTLIYHFERTEPNNRDVTYTVSVNNGKTYKLKVKAMNLNLYATGVGMLTFYLSNEFYTESDDILKINQYGRRIFPPFFGDIDGKNATAAYLQIEGLNGEPSNYKEDFQSYKNPNESGHYHSWKPACFIRNLIADLSESLVIKPVIDDRMFLNCWFKNNTLVKEFGTTKKSLNNFYTTNDFWYKYLFVDSNDPTCQNDEMCNKLIENQTYTRWQKWGTLYGLSRYSFVMLTNYSCPDFLLQYFQTMYVRMTELILVQRASCLRFSEEVNRVSKLSKSNAADKKIVKQVSSLYKEYIRFVNRIYFQEVTAQEQGIELYEIFCKTMKMNDYVKELDEEIAELHQYVHLLDDKIRNQNAEFLNYIAAIFLPATVFFGWLSTNDTTWTISGWLKLLIGAGCSAMMLLILQLLTKKHK